MSPLGKRGKFAYGYFFHAIFNEDAISDDDLLILRWQFKINGHLRWLMRRSITHARLRRQQRTGKTRKMIGGERCLRIPLGANGAFTLVVAPEHLANRFKDAILPPVLATPLMILAMENAALNAIRNYLEPGESTPRHGGRHPPHSGDAGRPTRHSESGSHPGRGQADRLRGDRP